MPSVYSQKLHLLLLPFSPQTLSLECLRSVYGPGLSRALLKASQFSRESAASTLDIAVAHEDKSSSSGRAVPLTFSRAQRLLALIYRLICIICTEESIGLQNDNDVNVSVILFRADLGKHIETQDTSRSTEVSIGRLEDLASCQRPWKCIYYLDNGTGKTLFKYFLQIKNESSSQACEHLVSEGLEGPANLVTSDPHSLFEANSPEHFPKRHYSVAVGGTFDHLHAGHKLLLTMTTLLVDSGVRSASSPERTLTIGITGDKLLRNKQFIDELEDWNTRQLRVEEFLLGMLEMVSPHEKLKLVQPIMGSDPDVRKLRNEFESGLVINYVEILDPFGPTITDELISALVVSGETRAGGEAVNEKRQAKGWPLLEVFEVEVLDADDKNHRGAEQDESYKGKISSTEIRRHLHERSAAT